jgi:hypothetical protein
MLLTVASRRGELTAWMEKSTGVVHRWLPIDSVVLIARGGMVLISSSLAEGWRRRQAEAAAGIRGG